MLPTPLSVEGDPGRAQPAPFSLKGPMVETRDLTRGLRELITSVGLSVRTIWMRERATGRVKLITLVPLRRERP
jgi:hypothetical protein